MIRTYTQEDPIGLAGGLNLYGFAGGDPVNFSDPFGLCPPKPSCDRLGATAGQRATEHWARVANTNTGPKRAGAVALGLFASLWTPDTYRQTTATLAGGLVIGRALGPCACVDGGDDPEFTRRNPDGSTKEPGQQYEEIDEAQRRNAAAIHSTKKSRQRDQQELEEEAARALEEARRIRPEQ